MTSENKMGEKGIYDTNIYRYFSAWPISWPI